MQNQRNKNAMNNKIEIYISNPDGKVIILALPEDANTEDWKDIFRTILTFQTFGADCIKEFFNEE